MEKSVMNEYGVIGSLLLDASLMPEASALIEDDFSFVPLREIFRAMRRQYAENGTFDALTIRGEAGKVCADVTDGLLMQTLEITPTAANLPAYASEVKSESLSRKLQKLAGGLLDAEQDPETALAHAQDVIEALSREQGAGNSLTLKDALDGLWCRVEEQVDGASPCIASGFPQYDKLLGGGFISGGLHVIGARPAVGKSALALQITLNAARNGVKVLYVSLEMDGEDCAARLVGNICGSSAARLMFGENLSEGEYGKYAQGTSSLSALPIVFNKRSGMSMRQIEALCFREKPGLMVIDHLGLLEPPEPRMSLYEATTKNSRALKLLAMRRKIPIVCLCQLNRAGASDRSGGFRATMANLRESGAIEQDADTVTLLHNPPCESNGPELLELWLDKNRHGPVGHVDATFYKTTGRIVC